MKDEAVKNSAPTMWGMAPVHLLEQVHETCNEGGVHEKTRYAFEAVRYDAKLYETKHCKFLESQKRPPKVMKREVANDETLHKEHSML